MLLWLTENISMQNYTSYYILTVSISAIHSPFEGHQNKTKNLIMNIVLQLFNEFIVYISYNFLSNEARNGNKIVKLCKGKETI